MASIIPNDTKASILNQEFDWSGNTYKLALLANTYTPDKDNDTFFSDVSSHQITGGGYTAGGQTLAGLTVVTDDTNDIAYLDATDEVFSSLTNTFRYGVIYESTGVESTSKIVAVIDYGQDLSPYNGDFTHQFASDGAIKLTE